jgi:hypothetical protein
MSSTTVSEPSTQAAAAGPGSGIYLAFIPWIVFTLVAQHSTLKLAAVGALLASVMIAARSARAGGAKVLELGAVLAFLGFTVIAFQADPATAAFVDRYARAIAAGLLSLIALGSLLVMPFTEQYARETTPAAVWKSPVFRAVNRRISAVFGVVVLAMAGSHIYSGYLEAHHELSRRENLVLNWAIPIALILLALKFVDRVTGENTTPTPTPTATA